MVIAPISTVIGSPPGFSDSAGLDAGLVLVSSGAGFSERPGARPSRVNIFRSDISPSLSRSTRISGLTRAIFVTRAYLGQEKSIPSKRRLSNCAAGVFSPGAVIVNFSIQLRPREVAASTPLVIVTWFLVSPLNEPANRAGTGKYAW